MDEIEFLQKVVEISSVTGQEKELAEFLAGQMKEWGMVSKIDETGNAIGIAGKGKKTIILTSHMDTVSGNIPIRVENGKLYGRGTVDAKGGLAAFAWIAKDFVDTDKLKIIFIGVVDEEGVSKGARFILDKYKPDFVINGEPSGWDGITIGYRGSLGFTYSLQKEEKHFAAQEGVVLEFNNFLNNIIEKVGRNDISFDNANVEVRKIEAEHHKLKAEIVIRFPLEFDIEGLKGFIEENKGNSDIVWGEVTPAVLVDKNNPLVRNLLSAIRREGGEPRFKKKTGTSDMNLFVKWSCPVVTYAPGDSSLDHTPNEHIDLEEYKKSIRVLKGVISNLQ